MATIYVAMGSNVGERETNLREAIEKMRAFAEVKKVSSLIETDAAGPNQGQPKFINAVAELETTLKPEEVLDELLHIEQELGRDLSEKGKNMPRKIDLDLVVYANEIIITKRLQVPHPRLTERKFVLAPLAELNPTWTHPETKESIQDMLKKLK